MKRNESTMKSWQREADQLRLTPDNRVWERLENRLDQDKGKVSIHALRKWLAIAASAAILITAGFLISRSMQPVITMVEELDSTTPQPYMAVYRHASDIKAAYADGKWVHIKEGSREKLRTSNLHRSESHSSRKDTM